MGLQPVDPPSRKGVRRSPLALAAFLGLAAAGASADDSPGPALKTCAAISDAPSRLACFDALARGSASATTDAAHPSHWRIQQNKSSLDSDAEPTGLNVNPAADPARSDPAAIVLRCRRRKTEFFVATSGSWGEGVERFAISYRINDGAPIDANWTSSASGKAAFAPDDPVAFAQSLPDPGTLFVRILDADGEAHEATFTLDGIAEIRRAIALACGWS
jgi:hypothetical protein